MPRRTLLVPVLAAVAAVAFFIAGVVAWRMFPSLPRNTPVYGTSSPNYPLRLHPLRAELLWAASALLALVAIRTALRQRHHPDTAQTFSG